MFFFLSSKCHSYDIFVSFHIIQFPFILFSELERRIEMSFIGANPNPKNTYVGDCVIRALAIATDKSWHETYIELAIQGLMLCDMPSSNSVWGEYLSSHNFTRHSLSDTCPNCYTVRDFCNDFPEGTYVLGTGSHAIAVIDGDYYDTWDSGDETPLYYWQKEN